MFKRLFVLLLLVVATLSISMPARASTLSALLSCEQTSGSPTVGNFSCIVFVSGGSPSYTYHWYEYDRLSGYFLVYQGEPYYDAWCATGVLVRVKVVVTDSAGAQVERTSSITCRDPY
ncbi:MAG TPA: hypothetical protein VGD58_23985 [Herpetosiphonaceae bacterium]